MSKQISLQKYCVECGRVSGRFSFGGTYAFHFWCWLRWLWRGLTQRTPDVCPECGGWGEFCRENNIKIGCGACEGKRR